MFHREGDIPLWDKIIREVITDDRYGPEVQSFLEFIKTWPHSPAWYAVNDIDEPEMEPRPYIRKDELTKRERIAIFSVLKYMSIVHGGGSGSIQDWELCIPHELEEEQMIDEAEHYPPTNRALERGLGGQDHTLRKEIYKALVTYIEKNFPGRYAGIG